MSLATWREVPLASLETTEGWCYDDPVTFEKLCTSLRRHGQLRALVVRHASDGALEVVDGRTLLRAMRAVGLATAWCADIGVVDIHAATQLRLDLETACERDYARLAYAVAMLVEAGASPASLAAASPFSQERIGHFVTLAAWDWSQFSGAAEGQGALAWDDLPEPAQAAPPAAMPPGQASAPEPPPAPALEPPMAVPEAVPAPELVLAAEPGRYELPVFPGMVASIPPQPLRPGPREDLPRQPPRRVREDPQMGLF